MPTVSTCRNIQSYYKNTNPESPQLFVETRGRLVLQLSNPNRISCLVLSGPSDSNFLCFDKNISQNICKSSFSPLIDDDAIITTSKEKDEMFFKMNPQCFLSITTVFYEMPEVKNLIQTNPLIY